MSTARIVRFYLHSQLREKAEAGRHNFIARVAAVLTAHGFRVEYRLDTETERLKSAMRKGYAMFHMDDPFHDRALTMRLAYLYPFWRIEASAKRWEWEVALTPFDAADVDEEKAHRFVRATRKRLFPGMAAPRRDGFVYVPLQGLLTRHRSFQSCSPIKMVEAVLEQDDRPVIATLHPKETYARADLSALETLQSGFSRLEIRTGGMDELLPGCDYIVSQNSAVSFTGYLFGKPSVLFGQIDFHHIAANVADLGVAEAFRAVRKADPPYDAYLWWFLQKMSINAGRADADEKIAALLRRRGWDL